MADSAVMMNDGDDVCGSTASCAAVAPRRLFSLQSVNSYGSTETCRLVDDGKPLDFDGEYTSRKYHLDLWRFEEKQQIMLLRAMEVFCRKYS